MDQFVDRASGLIMSILGHTVPIINNIIIINE